MSVEKRYQQIFAYTFGIAFLVIMLIIAIYLPKPQPFQFFVFRVVLSLAAAGTAAMIPGFLSVQVSTFVRAGGALAVFALVYLYNPAALVAAPEEPFKSIIRFNNLNLDASVEDGQAYWNYGFTSVEDDPKVIGNNVIIKQVKATLDVTCEPKAFNADIWILLGGADFGLPPGQKNHAGYPPNVINGGNSEGNPTPQTQLKIGIGGGDCPPQISVDYDFITQKRSGLNFHSLKESFNPPMQLSDGLFAQVFVWTGDPRYKLHVHGVTLELAGTKTAAL
jgi:hypothetical protein